jgi:hypothetical protein
MLLIIHRLNREALLTVSGLASSLLTIIDDILDISKSRFASFEADNLVTYSPFP